LTQQPRNFDSIRVASHEVVLFYFGRESLNNISTECEIEKTSAERKVIAAMFVMENQPDFLNNQTFMSFFSFLKKLD